MSNPFWDYSLSVYSNPGVADACLSAQDECGLDVNLVLYAGWLSLSGRVLTEEHLALLEAAVVEWRERAVVPLRSLRRDLTTLPGAGALREQIKALELSAERAQQDIMWQCFRDAPPLPVSPPSLVGNLECVFRASGARDGRSGSCRQRLQAALEGVAEAPAQ